MFFPPIPLLRDTLDPVHLLSLLKGPNPITKQFPVCQREDPSSIRVVFVLDDKDATSNYVRAFQELPILKTRVQIRHKDGSVELMPSFHDVWYTPLHPLPFELCKSDDAQEAKWTLQRKYGYRMATTFMPAYARAIYEHFLVSDENPEKKWRILDPCAGWGDRMIGLLTSAIGHRCTYTGFDPNADLFPGYRQMMECANVHVVDANVVDANDHVDVSPQGGIEFVNGYEIRQAPFECAASTYAFSCFDFAFTSPPFFDFEVYNASTNPTYTDWIAEFYVPLFVHTSNLLKEGAFFVVYLDDTTAGKITEFMESRVREICELEWTGKIGFRGTYSGKVREIYVFQKRIAHL
jgi:hypothetical protein